MARLFSPLRPTTAQSSSSALSRLRNASREPLEYHTLPSSSSASPIAAIKITRHGANSRPPALCRATPGRTMRGASSSWGGKGSRGLLLVRGDVVGQARGDIANALGEAKGRQILSHAVEPRQRVMIAISANLGSIEQLLGQQEQPRCLECGRLDQERLSGRWIATDVRRQVGKRRTQDSTSFCPLVERRKRSVAAEGSDLAASGHGALASNRGG